MKPLTKVLVALYGDWPPRVYPAGTKPRAIHRALAREACVTQAEIRELTVIYDAIVEEP